MEFVEFLEKISIAQEAHSRGVAFADHISLKEKSAKFSTINNLNVQYKYCELGFLKHCTDFVQYEQ